MVTFINVQSSPYNCVGDGVTDDTGGIQAAITVARSYGSPDLHTGGTIYFPRPKVYYKVSCELNFDNTIGIKLLGDQRGAGGNPTDVPFNAATLMFTQCPNLNRKGCIASTLIS